MREDEIFKLWYISNGGDYEEFTTLVQNTINKLSLQKVAKKEARKKEKEKKNAKGFCD